MQLLAMAALAAFGVASQAAATPVTLNFTSGPLALEGVCAARYLESCDPDAAPVTDAEVWSAIRWDLSLTLDTDDITFAGGQATFGFLDITTAETVGVYTYDGAAWSGQSLPWGGTARGYTITLRDDLTVTDWSLSYEFSSPAGPFYLDSAGQDATAAFWGDDVPFGYVILASYAGTGAGWGDDVPPAPVPLPASFLLLAGGLGGLLLRARSPA